MPGPDHPDAPPPGVPEEFAAAYREAYRRALEADPAWEPGSSAEPSTEPDLPEVPPQQLVAVGTHRTVPRPSVPTAWRSSRWFLPVALATAAVLLVLAAYGVGRAFSAEEPPSPASGPTASRSTAAQTDDPTAEPSAVETSTAPHGWEGGVTPVTVDAISADCTAPPGRDAAGEKVTYSPENAIDDELQTAWRCPGTAIGEQLTLRLAEDVDVAEVGLVAGYAKTDPESGVDRYAENNRITKVRWTFGDGDSIVQRLNPDSSSRALQLLRVPRTTTDTVRLEILEVRRGPRNTTAISAVVLYAAK